ncbi:MAG: helix-turn-helix domain-containing protein [Maioricimonas sp. JB049]
MFWYFLRMEDWKTFRQEFVERLAPDVQLATLFDFLPELYLYVKNHRSQFIRVNQAHLRLRGFSHESEIIGKTDFDLHPRYLAEQYVNEDRRVMQAGRPLPNQVWLVPGQAGALHWYLSSKIPLFDREGEAIGIAGVLRDLRKFETVYRPYQAMDEILKYVLEHYGERIDIPDLAAMAHLSVSQFDRRFKALFQMTPQQYLLRVRINAASHALTSTDDTVATIALRCGFYDQSYFTKRFRRETGMTPLAYRRRYAHYD